MALGSASVSYSHGMETDRSAHIESPFGMKSHGSVRAEPPKRLFRATNRTREGRFLKHSEAQLVAQLGAAPSFAQLILIRRAARAMLQLEKLDTKMASGNWTDHDARTFGGLSNNLRLCLRELGVRKADAASVNPLAAYLAQKAGAP
jgi:hypothetical protein